MHPVRIGRIVRTLRRRRGWRQVDLGARAGVSQQAVSLVETSRCRMLSIDKLDRILRALDAEIELVVRWRGGELDKVLDAGHATLEGMLAEQLVRDGWRVELEVTYAIGGDRGSVDLLAFHPEHAALLVAEIKSDVTSADGTLRRHDEKVRLGATIARERFGWVARSVSRLLVLPDASTRAGASVHSPGCSIASIRLAGTSHGAGFAIRSGRSRGSCSCHLPRLLVLDRI